MSEFMLRTYDPEGLDVDRARYEPFLVMRAVGASVTLWASPRPPRAGSWCRRRGRSGREERLDGAVEGLALLPEVRRDRWAAWLAETEVGPPERFVPNGFTVPALQAACQHTPVDGDRPASHLEAALHRAIAIGDDTDTVAAIAGALLGGRWGATAIPSAWVEVLHGWPGLRVDDLARLARRIGGNEHPSRPVGRP